jgi:glutathione reductase (NADPH)
MWNAASLREALHGKTATAEGYGFDVSGSGELTFDWAGVKQRRDAYIKRLNGVYASGWTKAGAELVMGAAEFVDAKTVKIALLDGGFVQFLDISFVFQFYFSNVNPPYFLSQGSD